MTDCEGVKDRVLQRLESDLSSADMQWSLFMSALESYRHDSILRPFPSAYVQDGGNKNFQRLVSVIKGSQRTCSLLFTLLVFATTMYTVVHCLQSSRYIYTQPSVAKKDCTIILLVQQT